MTFVNTAYTHQHQFCHITAHLDWIGLCKCHFCVSFTKINSIHWWLITKSVWCTLPIPLRTNSRINKLQPIWSDLDTFKISQPACGWLQNQLNGDCLYLSVKYQPIWTDLRSVSAISAFQSQNKLGPLVAHFKIGCMNSVYTLQDQLSQISANWDWFGCSKCYFSASVTK